MNKQSMWFLTLFSLILVLSVYYITMPSELLLQNNSSYNKETENVLNETDANETEVTIEESEEVIALRTTHVEEIQKEMSELQKAMMDESTTNDAKNEAFEQIQMLTSLQGQEEKIETKLKNTYKVDNFVKIDNSTIKVVVAKREHDVNLANDMMKTIQEEFNTKMYITIKFAND